MLLNVLPDDRNRSTAATTGKITRCPQNTFVVMRRAISGRSRRSSLLETPLRPLTRSDTGLNAVGIPVSFMLGGCQANDRG